MVQSQGRAEEVVVADGRMRIGEFADAVGVSVDAIRFYERRGVLRPAPRTAGGYRTFDDRDADRVRMARQFQQLGLTVTEVVDALAAHDVGNATCDSERWRLEQVENRIDAQLAQLRRTRRLIRDALASCEDGHCQFAVARAQDGGM
jgi:DNA-binding transcriptional MerR regulator